MRDQVGVKGCGRDPRQERGEGGDRMRACVMSYPPEKTTWICVRANRKSFSQLVTSQASREPSVAGALLRVSFFI